MTANHLGDDLLGDLINLKRAFVLCYARQKNNLKKEIAEFRRKFLPVTRIHRIQHFIGLFQHHGLESLERLLAVPRTATRPAQPIHKRHQLQETLSFHWRNPLSTTVNLYAPVDKPLDCRLGVWLRKATGPQLQ